jgi:sec-independent protein translocase protein TatB
VPDIGLGEIIVIVVVALLVFGPDRLPKVAADAARMLRQVRLMAASARKDLVDAAGLEDDGEMSQTVRDLRDLDPRRAMKGVLSDDPAPTGPASAERPGPGAQGSTSGPGAGVMPAAGSAPGAAPNTGAGAQPIAPPVVAPAQADPDWT